MTIVKTYKKEKNFTVIDNEPLIDPGLSWKATGLLAFLLSKPSNWRVSITHLASVKTDGKDATIAALEELKRSGYVFQETFREAGRFQSEYTVFETKDQMEVWLRENNKVNLTNAENPYRKNRGGLTEMVNPPLVIKERLNTEEKKELVFSADAEPTNKQWQSQESEATQLTKNPGRSEATLNSSESGSQNSHEETTMTQGQKDSAPLHVTPTQNAPKQRKPKRTPEEIAAAKAQKEQEKREKAEMKARQEAEKQAEIDRKNKWRYDLFRDGKEDYLDFNKWFFGVFLKDPKSQWINDPNGYYSVVLRGMNHKDEEYLDIQRRYYREKAELLQEKQKQTEADQKNALAAQAANPQPTQPTISGDRPQLPSPEDYLSPTNLAAFNKANFDDDLRAECIMKTYGKAEFSQANTIRGLAVQQSNRNKSKA